jgi:hypothetical protein
MNYRPEPLPDDHLPFCIKIPAIGIIDKEVSAIREKPADKFGLVLNDIAIPLLALAERVFCFFTFGDVDAGICHYLLPPGISRNIPCTLIKDETQSEVYMGVGATGYSYATMAAGEMVSRGTGTFTDCSRVT